MFKNNNNKNFWWRKAAIQLSVLDYGDVMQIYAAAAATVHCHHRSVQFQKLDISWESKKFLIFLMQLTN